LVSAVVQGELDLLKVQRDLESESVEWSNKKINKVGQAIRELWQKYQHASPEIRE